MLKPGAVENGALLESHIAGQYSFQEGTLEPGTDEKGFVYFGIFERGTVRTVNLC
jgi:hypothetical protein